MVEVPKDANAELANHRRRPRYNPAQRLQPGGSLLACDYRGGGFNGMDLAYPVIAHHFGSLIISVDDRTANDGYAYVAKPGERHPLRMELGEALRMAIRLGAAACWVRHVNGNHYRALVPVGTDGRPRFHSPPRELERQLSEGKREEARGVLHALDASTRWAR